MIDLTSDNYKINYLTRYDIDHDNVKVYKINFISPLGRTFRGPVGEESVDAGAIDQITKDLVKI
jgi:hypothetical protein